MPAADAPPRPRELAAAEHRTSSQTADPSLDNDRRSLRKHRTAAVKASAPCLINSYLDATEASRLTAPPATGGWLHAARDTRRTAGRRRVEVAEVVPTITRERLIDA